MSDRCYPHGARACRRCETPGEHLDAETLAEWREWIGQRLMLAMSCNHDGDDFGPGAVCNACFDAVQRVGAICEDALSAERAAHATTKAELEKTAAKLRVAMRMVAAGKPSDRSEKAEAMLAAAEARAAVLAAKVARVEDLANECLSGCDPVQQSLAWEIRAALRGDE